MDHLIAKYLTGSASAEEKKQLLYWLRETDENRKLFSDMYDVWQLSAKDIIEKKEIDFAFLNFKRNVSQQTRFNRQFFLTIAASLILLFISSITAFWIGRTHNGVPQEKIVMNQVIMGENNKGMILLPDSTEVWLNSNSKIIYPDFFAANERKVMIYGEAYLNVKKETTRIFIVQTSNLTITVLGTSFDVKNYDDKEEVILVSGKVDIETATGDKIRMYPNQKLSYNRLDGKVSLREINPQDYIVWRNEKLIFYNERLATILHKLKYWYNLDIKTDKYVPSDLRLSLTIRRETKEELFQTLELIAPIRCAFDSTKNQVMVRGKK